jgi:hypothetical protein
LFSLKTAYKEFEESAGHIKSLRGVETALVESAIDSFTGDLMPAPLSDP